MVPGALDGYDDYNDDEDDAAVDDDDEVRRDAPAITSGQFLFHGVLSFVPSLSTSSRLVIIVLCGFLVASELLPSACVLLFSLLADRCVEYRRPIVISIFGTTASMLDVLSC